MSITSTKKGCIAASVMAIAVSGLIVNAAPAQAAKCLEHGFSVGEVRIQSEDGTQLIFSGNGGGLASGPARLSGLKPPATGDLQGTVSGGITETRVDVGFTAAIVGESAYKGNVGDDGVARGTGPGNGWISTAITCVKEEAQAAPPPPPPVEAPAAPKQGPEVFFTEQVTGVTFTVRDRSGVASRCTYSSEGFTKSFGLPANGTVDVFVPAVRLFKQRNGTITCDNGTSSPTSVFF